MTLNFCLFRTWFLQATQAVKIKFEKGRQKIKFKNQLQKSTSKINFKNQFSELEISKIKCRWIGGMYIYLKFCTLSCKTGIRCPPTNPTSTYKSGQVLNLIAVYNDLPKRFLSARKMHPSCNGRYWHISPVHVKRQGDFIS